MRISIFYLGLGRSGEVIRGLGKIDRRLEFWGSLISFLMNGVFGFDFWV